MILFNFKTSSRPCDRPHYIMCAAAQTHCSICPVYMNVFLLELTISDSFLTLVLSKFHKCSQQSERE